MNRQLPVALGYNSILFNVGKTENKGFELALNTVNIDFKMDSVGLRTGCSL